MSGQAKLTLAIVDKLRTDTGAGGLVELTHHDASSPAKYRILRDQPPTKGKLPFLGVAIYQSTPLMDDGPSQVETARVYFHCYSTSDLTAITIADRLENLLHAKAEQLSLTNVGHYDFSSSDISNRQTRWKSRDVPDFDDETDVWHVLVEADVIWIAEPCGS